MKCNVSFNDVSRHSTVFATHGTVKQLRTNQTHTQGLHGRTLKQVNPKNQMPELQSPVIFSGRISANINRNFPELSNSGTIQKLFHPRIQISCSYILNHARLSRSNKNIIEIQTLNQHNMLISHPFSNINISACSTQPDLYDYVH